MKRTSIFNSVIFSACCGVLAVGLVGCGGKEGGDPVASNNSAPNVKPASESASDAGQANGAADSSMQAAGDESSEVAATSTGSSPTKKTVEPELKGVWYGESVFDVDAFNARLAQLEPQQAAQLQQMVNTFSSIVMAAEFRPDAVMELDMMLTTNEGQQLRDRSVGTWKVLQKTTGGLTIETSEYKNQDQQPTQKVYVYQFIDNDRFQFIPDSISPDIREFSPRIIFQRVEQPLEEANVAEGENPNVVR